METTPSNVYQTVHLDQDALAQKAYDLYGTYYPEICQGYSAYQRSRTLEDFKLHIRYIQESLAVGDPAILIDYAGWAQVLLTSLGLPKDCLSSSLAVLQEVLHKELSPEMSRKTDAYITASIRFLETAPTEVPSFIETDNPRKELAISYLDALLAAQREKAIALIMDSVENGVSVRDLYLHVFQPVLCEVGKLWQMQMISVAQEHYVTAATQLTLAQLYPRFMTESRKRERRGKMLVAACVSDELHEIGIRMVSDFFEMDGWNTYYIGANTPAEGLVSAVRERRADVVALSSTMSFHLPLMDHLIRSLRSSQDTQQVTIIVGGYPFNIIPDLWKKVGADAYAENADEAVAIANRFVGL